MRHTIPDNEVFDVSEVAEAAVTELFGDVYSSISSNQQDQHTAKDVYGGIHTAGSVILSLFGAGSVVPLLTSAENQAGLLPAWAGGAASPPDFVVVVRPQNPNGDVFAAPQGAAVVGGKRFAGNGYKTGDGVGRTFSYGYDAPAQVDVIQKDGKKISFLDAKQVLFLGGTEGQTHVTGDPGDGPKGSGKMSHEKILGQALQILEKKYELIGEVDGDDDLDYTQIVGEVDGDDDLDYTQIVGEVDGDDDLDYTQIVGEAFSVLGVGERHKKAPKKIKYTVLGADSYLLGCDIIGAGHGMRSIFKSSKSAKPNMSAAAAAKKHPLHAAKKAKAAAIRASSAARKALAPAKSFPTLVHGVYGGTHVIGVVTPVKVTTAALHSALTPKQKKALDKYSAATAKASAATKKAQDKGKKALLASKTAVDAIKKATGAVKAMLSTKTVMHGDVVGDYIDDNGMQVASPLTKAPDDGSSPTYTDPTTDLQATTDVAPTPVVPIDTGVDHVPPDGVVYTGTQKGWPSLQFGSYSFFNGPKGSDGLGAWGFAWGQIPGTGAGNRWTLRNGGNRFGQANWGNYGTNAGDASVIAPLSLSGEGSAGGGGGDGITQGQWASYNGPVYGPLIGNPSGDFANLRWAQVDKQWFWYLEEAPAWATAELQLMAAKIQAAADAANQAAADAEQAAADKVAADQAAAQQQQDAANALAESAAQSQLNVAQTQAQAADQAAQQQEAAQAAQLELQVQQQNLQATQAQQQLEAKAAAADLDWAIAHPDQAAAAQQAPQDHGDGGGMDESDTTDRGADPFGGQSSDDGDSPFTQDELQQAQDFDVNARAMDET